MNTKLTLAAGLAAVAMTGICEGITSANIVGYMGKETPSSGSAMITPMFANVSATGKVKLSDLRGTGYDPDEGAYGDLYLSVLTTGGSDAKFESGEYEGMYKKFYWFDNEDAPAGWYDGNGETKFDGDSIEFSVGDAFWTSGLGQTVVAAGQVGKSQLSVETPASGSKAMGNPFATSLKLSKIYGSGYDPDDGAYGDLYLSVLTTGGSDAKFESGEYEGMYKKFYWFDNEDAPAGWYDGNGESAFDGDSIVFAPGDGLWVSGAGQTVVFQVPDALQ